jgi:hypothetical protein
MTQNFHLETPSNQFWVALIATLLFFVVTMPKVFVITGNIFHVNESKYQFIDKNGAPTKIGLFVHGIVFLILFWIYLAVVTTVLPNGY